MLTDDLAQSDKRPRSALRSCVVAHQRTAQLLRRVLCLPTVDDAGSDWILLTVQDFFDLPRKVLINLKILLLTWPDNSCTINLPTSRSPAPDFAGGSVIVSLSGSFFRLRLC